MKKNYLKIVNEEKSNILGKLFYDFFCSNCRAELFSDDRNKMPEASFCYVCGSRLDNRGDEE